jgi:hypothetical protein
MNVKDADRALAAKRRIEDKLLRQPGVHGVSIGPKRVNGELTDQLAITVHVTRKRPLAEIPAAERIPPQIEGIVTDVFEHPQLSPHAVADTGRYRPLQGGCQLQFSNWLGTLGAFCTNNANGFAVGLTNHHVLPSGGDVFQPDNSKGNKIGVVGRTVLSSTVDAAFVVFEGTTWTNAILDAGIVNGPRVIGWGDLPCPVTKRGRTTRRTAGRVTNLAFSGTRTDGWSFRDQQLIEPDGGAFSAGGDSGSAVIDGGCRVVGLLWGGNDTIGAASPIAAVQDALGVRVTSGGVWQLSEPVASYDQLRQQVQTQLVGSVDGQRLVVFWEEHQAQVADLVHHNKRVAALWRRNHGDDVLRVFANHLQDADAPFPDSIAGEPARQVLERLEAALLQHGDDRLRGAWAQVRPIVEHAFGRSFREMAAGLRKAPAHA